MIDFQVARDKLGQFETADELADFFRYEGVTGRCLQSLQCPIAQWMQTQTQMRVYVNTTEIWNLDNVNLRPANTVAMADFVNKFDNGEYSDLEDNTQPAEGVDVTLKLYQIVDAAYS